MRRSRSSSRRAMPENRAISSAAIRAGSVRLPRVAAAGSPVSGAKSGLASEKSDTGNKLSRRSATNTEMTIESWSTRGRGAVSGAGRVVSVVSAEASGRSSRASSQGESSASACGSASCIASPRPMATGDTRQAPSNRMPRGARLSTTKAILAPSSARTTRRSATCGDSPEKASHQRYPAAAKEAPSSTSPAIMGTVASSKSIPVRSRIATLVVKAGKSGSMVAAKVRPAPARSGIPKARPPRFATARHPAKPKRSPASHDSVSGI